MDDEGADIADIGEMAGQFHMVDEMFRRLIASLEAKAEDASETVAQILLRQSVGRMILQAGIVDMGNLRMGLKPMGQRQGIVDMPLHAERECFDSLQKEEGIERAECGAEIAQAFDPGADDEGDVAEGTFGTKRLVKVQTVVTRRG